MIFKIYVKKYMLIDLKIAVKILKLLVENEIENLLSHRKKYDVLFYYLELLYGFNDK